MAELLASRPGRVCDDSTVERLQQAQLTPALATELAWLTRTAYTGSDPLPGLPAPDGQFETADAVTGPVYTATLDGRRVAALRVRLAGDRWRVARVSVLPDYRGRGLVRRLLDVLAADARRQRIDWLELDAVVERCLPPRYARLGFRTQSNWPSPDKPLSELTMRRATAEPADPVPLGWPEARLSRHATVIGWLLSGRTLLRVCRPASGDPLADLLAAARAVGRPGLLLAGVDLSPQPAGELRIFPDAGRIHPEHLMPRSRQADTLALWRPVPGWEVPLDELAGGRP